MSRITLTDSTHSIRYQTDKLITKSTGIYTSNEGGGFDLTNAQTVTGFNIIANAPAGTGIFFAFKTDDSWFSLDAQGNAQEFAYDISDFETLEASGNTPSDLRGIGNIPAFVGKQVQVAIGLSSDNILSTVPTVSSLGVYWINPYDMRMITLHSPVYDLAEDGATVISLRTEQDTSTGADIEASAQLTLPDGSVTDWLPLSQCTGLTARKLQFRANYSVAQIGEGTARLYKATGIYTGSNDTFSGLTDTEIYSLTQDWYIDITQCRLTVKHSELRDSGLKAYVCLRNAPISVMNETLGTGSGEKVTYELANKVGVKYDSVKLYFDGREVYTNYEINTEAARITCTPGEGVIVSCDYEFGWESEEWREMDLHSRAYMGEQYQSEYRLYIEEEHKTLCAIRLVLQIRTGHSDDEDCGLATGGLQTIRLEHYVRDENVKVFADGVELSQDDYILQEDTQYIRLTALKGAHITVSYDWQSLPPTVYQFAAVFA